MQGIKKVSTSALRFFRSPKLSLLLNNQISTISLSQRTCASGSISTFRRMLGTFGFGALFGSGRCSLNSRKLFAFMRRRSPSLEIRNPNSQTQETVERRHLHTYTSGQTMPKQVCNPVMRFKSKWFMKGTCRTIHTKLLYFESKPDYLRNLLHRYSSALGKHSEPTHQNEQDSPWVLKLLESWSVPSNNTVLEHVLWHDMYIYIYTYMYIHGLPNRTLVYVDSQTTP